jgi:hypothetical protein
VQFIDYQCSPVLRAEVGIDIASDFVDIDDLVSVAAQYFDGFSTDSLRTAGNSIDAIFAPKPPYIKPDRRCRRLRRAARRISFRLRIPSVE